MIWRIYQFFLVVSTFFGIGLCLAPEPNMSLIAALFAMPAGSMAGVILTLWWD